MARETALQRVQRLSQELEQAEAELDRELAAAARAGQPRMLQLIDGGHADGVTSVRWDRRLGDRKTS